MSLLYAALRPLDVEAQFAQALQAKDPDELLVFSAPFVSAFKDLDEWFHFNGGRTLCSFGENYFAVVSVDKAPDFTKFLKQWEYTTKTCWAVGLGASPLEAFYAMRASEAGGAERVVLYSQDVEEMAKPMLVESESDMSKAENQYNLDFPNLNLAEEPAQAGQQPAQPEQQQVQPQVETQGTDSVKQKIVQALMELKQNAQVIAQIKQVSPEAYQAVAKLVEAMLAMAKDPQEVQPQQPQQQEQPQNAQAAGS